MYRYVDKFNTHPLRRLLRLARRLGLNVKFNASTTDFYENKTIHLYITEFDLMRDLPQAAYNLCHEISHYIIAKPGQRRLKDYALKGGGPGHSQKRFEYENGVERKIEYLENFIKSKVGLRHNKKLEEDQSSRETNWPSLGWWLDHKEQYTDLVNLLLS